MARKYAQIFVRGRYLFREANSFPRAKLEENCELRGTDNVQGQISEHIFKVKLRLLCLLSFKYFSICQSVTSVNHVKVFQLASKISTSFNSDFALVESICLRKKYIILKEKYNSVKDKSKIRVVNKVTGNLATFREQDQSNIAFRKMCKPP